MPRNRLVFFTVFGVAGCICALSWWHFADRWAYYNDYPNGLQPKFPVPFWWLAAESGVAGALGGGLATVIYVFLPRFLHRTKSA